jgi:hypothetical protein
LFKGGVGMDSKKEVIVEQQEIKNKTYVITRNQLTAQYSLWLNGEKLGEAEGPVDLYGKINVKKKI